MLDCQVALLENAIVRYMASGKVPGPIGNRHPSITPFEAFPSRDNYIVVCAVNENQWESYCRAIGHPELISDPRFDRARGVSAFAPKYLISISGGSVAAIGARSTRRSSCE